MKITACTTAYNGYGGFIPRWLKNVQAQTYPVHEIIIVLGHNHGLEEIPEGVKIIHHEQPATMGFLRNLAVDASTGDYIFFFAVDDILFGHALQEISNVDADIIALRYNLKDKLCVTPEIVAEKLNEWRQHYAGACGYMAFKKGLRNEDTDWPNFPLLFQAYKKGYTYAATEKSCAEYVQRPGGHGQNHSNHTKGFMELEKYILKYGLIP